MTRFAQVPTTETDIYSSIVCKEENHHA